MRTRMMMPVAVLAVVLMSLGCAGSNRKLQAKLMKMARTPHIEAEYRLAPPDRVSIEVKGYPEYSRSETVRPDGKITVPSIGDIYVKDMTMPDVSAAIAEGLKAELSQPVVTVTLEMAASKAVYVLGEVNRTGSQPYYGDMKIVDAIGQAGGIAFYGDMSKVTLTRESLDTPEVIMIDLKKLIQKGAAEQNVVIHEGDIIYVPPTPFAKVGYAFDQLLFPFRSILSGLVTYGGVRNALEPN